MDILNMISTVDEMAEHWGVNISTVRRWCDEGLVQARKMNKEWVLIKNQERPAFKAPAIKFKGLKKATGEFNHWVGPARVYLDLDTHEVFTVVYTDPNGDDEFESRVAILKSKMAMQENGDETTMRELQEIAECCVK